MRSVKCSFHNIDSTVYLLFGKLYNQDSVLGSQAHQHHETYLEVDIVLESTRPHTEVSS